MKNASYSISHDEDTHFSLLNHGKEVFKVNWEHIWAIVVESQCAGSEQNTKCFACEKKWHFYDGKEGDQSKSIPIDFSIDGHAMLIDKVIELPGFYLDQFLEAQNCANSHFFIVFERKLLCNREQLLTRKLKQ